MTKLFSFKHPLLKIALTVVAFSTSIAVVNAWSEPPSAPPNCPSGSEGCEAPINTGSGTQTKDGSLEINGYTYLRDDVYFGPGGEGQIRAFHSGSRFLLAPYEGTSWQWGREFGYNPSTNSWYAENKFDVNGAIRIRGGGPSDGKVLTAKDTAGNAEWRSPGELQVTTAGNSSKMNTNGWMYNGEVHHVEVSCPSGYKRTGCSGGIHRFRDSHEDYNENFTISELQTRPHGNGCQTRAMRRFDERHYRVYVYAYCAK